MHNWDDYRLILAMARVRSVRGAADALGINHATVSRRLAALSDQLGGPLFERIAGGYQATPLGETLTAAAERMEGVALDAARQARASDSRLAGPVTVSIPDAIGHHLLLDTLAGIARDHPELQLAVRLSYEFADLDRSQADIVVRMTAQPDDHLVGRELFPIHTGFYATPDYLARTADIDRVWITRSPVREDCPWLAHSPYSDARIGLSLSSLDLCHEAAARGMGMINGACYIADPDPRLTRLPGQSARPLAPLWVLTHPDLRHVPRIQTVMRTLTDALLEHRALITGERG